MEKEIGVVRVILEREGKILILKRAIGSTGGGKFCLPGGLIDKGMTAEETCVKEVKEETDLNVLKSKFLFKKIGKVEHGKKYIHNYFYATFSGDVKINEESSDYAWIDVKDMKKHDFAFEDDKAIEQYLSS